MPCASPIHRCLRRSLGWGVFLAFLSLGATPPRKAAARQDLPWIEAADRLNHLVSLSHPGRLPGSFWDPAVALRPREALSLPSLSLKALEPPERSQPAHVSQRLAASCRF